MSNKFRLLSLLVTLAVVASIPACGGKSQTPAETPAESSTEPASGPMDPSDAGMPEGEHVMPDGSTMPGHQHDDHEKQ